MERDLLLVALLALLATAVFLLTIIQRIFTGQVHDSHSELKDISYKEVMVISPLLLLTLYIGFYPATWLNLSNKFIETLSALIAG